MNGTEQNNQEHKVGERNLFKDYTNVFLFCSLPLSESIKLNFSNFPFQIEKAVSFMYF